MNKAYIQPKLWKPVGVDDIELNAYEVVFSNTNYSVIAGPGSGKTELLAQRACYLLQTGLCPSPYRILAISFKKDAANNLKERVAQRCSREDALRFDSLTFDAFAKGMLDRFIKALPEIWKPTSDYELYFPDKRQYEAFIVSLVERSSKENVKNYLLNTRVETFEKEWIFGSVLPPEGIEAKDLISFVVKEWWNLCLRIRKKSLLSFSMISRLVELLLRTNPKICNTLRATYSYVFMDEFQDTTHIQYDLVKTAFLHSSTILTAVGDNKQKIMQWAMALDDAFGNFATDFSAKSLQLFSNYRSSPQLVEIQHHLARTIDVKYEPIESKSECRILENACVVWDFETPKEEAEYLAQFISSSITTYNLTSKDFVILVKSLAKKYEPLLKKVFQKYGLKVRVTTQDILVEPITTIILTFLRFISQKSNSKYWAKCLNIVSNIRGIDVTDDISWRKTQEELDNLYFNLQNKINFVYFDESYIKSLLSDIEGFLGKQTIKTIYPEYQQGDRYEQVVQNIIKEMLKSSQTAYEKDWTSILDDFEGLDSVSIMTIHKSKGLEYHTVIFVGLDDTAWRHFLSQPEESRSCFFVAFSRAKQRAIFTYCEERGKKTDIASLYELLDNAGVKTEKIKVLIKEENQK